MDQKEKDIVIAWKNQLAARVKEINDELDRYQQVGTESRIKKRYIEDAITRGNTDLKGRSKSFRNTFDYEKLSNTINDTYKTFNDKSNEYAEELINLNYMISHLKFMLEND